MSDRLVPSGPIGIYLWIAGAAAGLPFLATLVPAWLAMRPSPLEAAVRLTSGSRSVREPRAPNGDERDRPAHHIRAETPRRRGLPN
jgi:hypothetical protein